MTVRNSAQSAGGDCARVAILLCTFNGARFLEEQLASIERQHHESWSLIASDDGSSDSSCNILAAFAARHPGRVEVREGPCQGSFVANFLSLIHAHEIDADYFAFCDQDDIWFPDKLTRAIETLSQTETGTPAVYCGRTRLIDEAGRPYGFSPLFSLRPDFRNAVIQSIGGGNTMVFNRAAREILRSATNVNPVSHDWWTYQAITSVGGHCYYDPVPTVGYRQHGQNAMGANTGWTARLARLRLAADGVFAQWTRQNLEAFKSLEHLMKAENREVLKHVEGMRGPSLISRLLHFYRSGVRRQTVYGNIGLFAAVMLRRV